MSDECRVEWSEGGGEPRADTLGEELQRVPRLAQLLDRTVVEDVCRSLLESFGLPVRVLALDGSVFASARDEREEASLAGGRERELPIEYDGRQLGKLVVGPEPFLERRNQLDRLALHFQRLLEALLFSGHRALLASSMHLASAEANYRELTEKSERLRIAYDKLKELDQLKSTFLATVSHELRTPLTSIIGYSEMLATGMAGELNPGQSEFIETVRAKADQLLELILSLLDVAKLEQGQLRLQLAPFDPEELIVDVLRTVAPAAAKRGVRLERRGQERLPKPRADKARLRQVLLNLMDNAIKFTPKGGLVTLEAGRGLLEPTPELASAGAVLLGAPVASVRFTVRDTGIGIPAEEHARIFDAFYQVDGSATREHGGTGLGLAIAKRLVEAHGGSIELSSAPQRGAEFRVSIPADE